jgi:hypothetical protein
MKVGDLVIWHKLFGVVISVHESDPLEKCPVVSFFWSDLKQDTWSTFQAEHNIRVISEKPIS